MNPSPKGETVTRRINKTIIYIVCIFLAVLSILPFWIMFVNATRSTAEIQSGLSLLPSSHLMSNLRVLLDKSFDPIQGFMNSFIISSSATILTVYFSSLSAYGLVTYDWKLRKPFFTFILCVMMIPSQASAIGFYQFMYKIHWTNSFLPLILPAIAAPAVVFFMRQYLLATLSLEIVEAARVDGSGEFKTFNRIILPLMMPAVATQAIFAFVANWNNLFMPLILLTQKEKYTMPVMVSLLRGDIYKMEFGSIYMGLALTALPLFVVYFLLSRYIIAGVALGGVKE
ncbi:MULTISPECIES: carbohydrate ABC transporter permease [Paenibacillus]|uniref:carbohydrate ABC transporter permease n=1 Tax=Paenibacillus TaxID=44249 RepID=UPI001C8D89CB|nr:MULTISPECIES: carbohydrate ABC transporter permease [Paenibacillus]MBY0010910.1 carbohydrate ABC transporter permease [Paenibacillus typhae]MDF9841564.1 multiple sugar transport system permease protein [Paenibacillus sp. PastF-2]MDF9848324.1 multiple sugar transport system permease protein [Paenibacillus sp. PastM-2]MDF9854723.1 multiple sugar transport system permease protein [Paenibacillus sp. PastF-1]MDH6479993.1 multiple sugar transport system permease protein [Paenibacillus sp. PastH-2